MDRQSKAGERLVRLPIARPRAFVDTTAKSVASAAGSARHGHRRTGRLEGVETI